MNETNEMNDLESQLRSWAPRRPSAKLEERLFATTPPSPTFRLTWLAPATAAFMLACVLFTRNNPALSGSADTGRMVALVLSNQGAPAYLPGSFQPEQNRLPADTIEWVRPGNAKPISPSLSASRGTNY